jgi:3-deoxy-D-manno-octulosonate 8-phosphate phosphatase (KDO 8-P phosphatase)
VESSAVAYIGDDLTDAVIMRRVGLPIATANARAEVKRLARYITRAAGGEGAVREVIELVLTAQNQWQDILLHYECC